LANNDTITSRYHSRLGAKDSAKTAIFNTSSSYRAGSTLSTSLSNGSMTFPTLFWLHKRYSKSKDLLDKYGSIVSNELIIRLICAPKASSDPGRTKASAQDSKAMHLTLGSSDSKNITNKDNN
jgi:hypothetical protein